MNITVIGSGVYGKAIAKILLEAKNNVTMWTEKDIKEVIVPKEIELTNDFEASCTNKDIIFILTGSRFVANILESIKPYLDKKTMVVLGSKGILENGTILTKMFENMLPEYKYGVISGPTFAVDIAALEPIGFTIATKDYDDFMKIKKALNTVYIEYSKDVHAIEMAGSLKNAYAIGSGILSGFNYGPSTRCLYITRVLKEMENIFDNLGFDKSSTNTLAGVGDLVLTCTSPNSRNFTFGTILSLGTKEESEKYLKNNTVEGYENLKAYIVLLEKENIKAPFLECVFNIVEQKQEASTLIKLLLA